MNQYTKEYRLELLVSRKLTIMKSLEWAIANNDKGLSEVCERELKVILKMISKIKKDLDEERGNQNGAT